MHIKILATLALCTVTHAVGAQALPSATSTQVGLGCGPAAVIPTLDMPPPVVGRVATATVLHSFDSSPGMLFVSLGAPVQTPLSAGVLPACNAYVDPATVVPLLGFVGLGIPPLPLRLGVPNPSFVGRDLTFQAAILPAQFPTTLVLTNGVHVVFGV